MTSASESICTPKSDCVRVRRATRPSTESKTMASSTAKQAVYKSSGRPFAAASDAMTAA